MRDQLKDIFEDTMKWIRSDETLRADTENAKQKTKFYPADSAAPSIEKREKTAVVAVTKERTFECAMRLHAEHPEHKIAVLNFASSTHPGGGVTNGATAQEECLCRCSNLYPALNQSWLRKKYYDVNRRNWSEWGTDALIYTPDVTVCKTDTRSPARIDPEAWVNVDVITAAAPNLRNAAPKWRRSQKLYDVHVARARRILALAAANGVDDLVLGAFGCGAFANDPGVVAQAYKTVVEEFKDCFDTITFAVYCSPRDQWNFETFRRALQ